MPNEESRAVLEALSSLVDDLDHCRQLMQAVVTELDVYSTAVRRRSDELDRALQDAIRSTDPRQSLLRLLSDEKEWLADLAMKLARAAGSA